jgi:hypothetical protein
MKQFIMPTIWVSKELNPVIVGWRWFCGGFGDEIKFCLACIHVHSWSYGSVFLFSGFPDDAGTVGRDVGCGLCLVKVDSGSPRTEKPQAKIRVFTRSRAHVARLHQLNSLQHTQDLWMLEKHQTGEPSISGSWTLQRNKTLHELRQNRGHNPATTEVSSYQRYETVY